MVNKGALSTKVYIKTNDGKVIPFFSMDDLRKREERQRMHKERMERLHEEAQKRQEQEEIEESKKDSGQGEPKEEVAEDESPMPQVESKSDLFSDVARLSSDEIEFEEFLAQVQFKRTTEIGGYS